MRGVEDTKRVVGWYVLASSSSSGGLANPSNLFERDFEVIQFIHLNEPK